MGEHVARLQDMLRGERAKVSCIVIILQSVYLYAIPPL